MLKSKNKYTVFGVKIMAKTDEKKRKRNKKSNKHVLDRRSTCFILLPWLLLIPLGLFLPSIVSGNSEWIESVYAKSIYPVISRILITLTSWINISIAELLSVVLIIGGTAFLLYLIIKLILCKIKFVRFLNIMLIIGIIGGAMINIFYINWGFNYFRKDISDIMGLEIKERSSEELSELCHYLSDKSKELRTQVNTNDDGVFYFEGSIYDKSEELAAAFSALAEDHDCFFAPVGKPKSPFLSELLSYAGISGIYIPFTAEANVNTHQPSLLKLSSSAHEMGHQLGFAHEDDANFIAFLCGLYSEDEDIAYSCTMLTLLECSNRLYSCDKDAYSELYSTYSDEMRLDLRDYSEYWDIYEGEVKQTVQNVNDNYLKHNQQLDGVESYGRMVDNVLAYYIAYIK